MYLREKRIKRLKVKNVIPIVIALFNLIFAESGMLYLAVRYDFDKFTLTHAKMFPDFVFWSIVGPLMLIYALWSRANIGDAYFYSGYFEGDLDGMITVDELAEVTGRSSRAVGRQLKLFSRAYMKNYVYKDKEGMVELSSKTAMCECRSCGARIEKKIYFTGECPYCRSSDLRAKVLTDGRFYSISNELGNSKKKADYYTASGLMTRKVVFVILLILSLLLILILAAYSLDYISKYNDKEYLRSIILDPEQHMQSYELIHYHIIDTVITNVIIIAGLIPVVINRIGRITCVIMADLCSNVFAGYRIPYVKASALPDQLARTAKKRLGIVRQSIKKGYLRNCTFERHNGTLEVALAKKIVKDQCPSCGASITGVVYKDHICDYCGRKIMDVVVKK
ncbi:MAG: hypothetical protein II782_03245 [Oscillospiraceae bacterium]|nr:hypothetical protein [Oscillospiraceae bacterium]